LLILPSAPTIMASTTKNEYNDLIRIPPSTHPSPGRTFIEAAAPTHIMQICREHTFAQGRILYEVYDADDARVLGYLVPNTVSRLATTYKHGINLASWNKVDLDQLLKLRLAHWELMQKFPRLPDIAAKAISEKAAAQGWKGDKNVLETKLVDYALHEWTSYDFRLEQAPNAGPSKTKEVAEHVKPRLREVLRSWLPLHTAQRDVFLLYRRHELVDAELQEVIGGSKLDMPPSIGLQNYGGSETVANITLRPDDFH